MLLASASAGASAAELGRWQGAPKPAMALEALDAGRVDLASLAGRPVLVHFFATWCEPCVREMAALDRLAADSAGTLTILAVDVGEVDAHVRGFLEKHPVGFPVLMDRDRAATRAWQVVALPTSYVIDVRQVAVLFAEGDVDWDDPDAARTLDEALTALPGTHPQDANDANQRETDHHDQPA